MHAQRVPDIARDEKRKHKCKTQYKNVKQVNWFVQPVNMIQYVNDGGKKEKTHGTVLRKYHVLCGMITKEQDIKAGNDFEK